MRLLMAKLAQEAAALGRHPRRPVPALARALMAQALALEVEAVTDRPCSRKVLARRQARATPWHGCTNSTG